MSVAITIKHVGAMHMAHMEPMSGTGFITCPSPGADAWLSMGQPTAGPSLNGSDWDVAVSRMSALGWEPLTEYDGSLVEAGVTDTGCPVFGIIAREPIINEPDLEHYVAADLALSESVGLVRA